MLITSIALVATASGLAALPVGAGAKTPLTVTKVRATWLGSSHRIFIDTTWTPKRFETKVTVKISVNGESLRTLQATHWVIGRKLFQLTVPETIAAGSKAKIEVRVHSSAGDDKTAVKLDLD